MLGCSSVTDRFHEEFDFSEEVSGMMLLMRPVGRDCRRRRSVRGAAPPSLLGCLVAPPSLLGCLVEGFVWPTDEHSAVKELSPRLGLREAEAGALNNMAFARRRSSCRRARLSRSTLSMT